MFSKVRNLMVLSNFPVSGRLDNRFDGSQGSAAAVSHGGRQLHSGRYVAGKSLRFIPIEIGRSEGSDPLQC